ncbi:hypothetical protein, partial [Vibrio vulnificus]|uniref:hypothetical protein n=1 Tax=Vibrio vulnificus TaxID=672 RepID=UPI0019D474AB
VLHNHLNNLGIKSFKESNWWPFYAYLQNLSIDNWESDIVKSDIFFNDCKGKIEQLLIAMEKLNL